MDDDTKLTFPNLRSVGSFTLSEGDALRVSLEEPEESEARMKEGDSRPKYENVSRVEASRIIAAAIATASSEDRMVELWLDGCLVSVIGDSDLDGVLDDLGLRSVKMRNLRSVEG